MLDSAGLIKRTCSALCLKEGLERAARTVHRSRCMVPIKFRSFVRKDKFFWHLPIVHCDGWEFILTRLVPP